MSVVIQFSTSGGLVAKGVQFRTFSWASHVDLVTSKGTLIGAEWQNGVSERPYERSEYERIERYVVEGVSQELVESIIRGELGKPYDFGAIWGFISRTDKFSNTEKWFCSELIAWVFQEANMPLLNPDVDAQFIAPSHLLMSPYLKKVALPQ